MRAKQRNVNFLKVINFPAKVSFRSFVQFAFFALVFTSAPGTSIFKHIKHNA